MTTVGQEEIVIVLETLPDETTIPRDIFTHLNTVYQDASKGIIYPTYLATSSILVLF